MTSKTTDLQDDPTAWENAETLADLAELLGAAGLELPFSPRDLAAGLDEANPGVFTTRAAVDTLYGLTALAGLWRSERPMLPLFAVGFDGYGLASRRFQLAIAGPALAMAMETPFGNHYADRDEELRLARRLLADMDELYRLTDGCRFLPGHPGGYWILVHSASDPFAIEISANGEETPVESPTPFAQATEKLKNPGAEIKTEVLQ